MIHLSQLHKIIEKETFSMKFVESDGAVIEVNNCICSSFFSRGRTLNIYLKDSDQTRKIRRCTIIEYNGEEVFL